MKNFLLFPILIFLSLFLFDKILLVPFIFERIIKNKISGFEVFRQINENSYKKFLKQEAEKKKVSVEEIENNAYVFFGSSRSAGFSELTSNDYKGNPYLKNQTTVAEIPVTANYIRAGSFFQILKLYNDFPKKKGTYILEINYTSFNQNSLFREKRDIYELTMSNYFEFFPYLSMKDRVEFFSSNLLLFNRYKVEFKRLFQPVEDQNLSEMMNDMLVLKKINDEAQIQKFNLNGFWIQGSKEGFEDKSLIQPYTESNNWVIDSFYKNFKLSTTDWNLFQYLLKKSKKEGTRLIILRPRIHRILRQSGEKYIQGETQWLKDVKELTSSLEIPFIDLDKEAEISCDYFTDTSHLSKSCFPEIIEKVYELNLKK
ncbi:MAG: DUF1574 family protein [Leptospiraceae bacterium]|nr:DUF1574 family protein [Leptospiraceae bacterium]